MFVIMIWAFCEPENDIRSFSTTNCPSALILAELQLAAFCHRSAIFAKNLRNLALEIHT
jgi:hypothetical protein